MFKKVKFDQLDYKDLDSLPDTQLRKENLKEFYKTFDFLNLIKKWPEIVGPKLQNVTIPMKLSQGRLTVVTKHGAYSQELSYVSEILKKEIFKFFPELKPHLSQITYVTNEQLFKLSHEQHIAQKNLSEQLHPQSPQYKLLRSKAEKIFSQEEPEIREKLISIYIQSMKIEN